MHSAKSCTVQCIDWRLQEHYRTALGDLGLIGSNDVVSLAGGSRDVTKPIQSAHLEAWWRQLDLSIKLHDPKRIVILDHQDCGGYAVDGTIVAGLAYEEDKAEHAKWARVAVDKVKERYPDRKVAVYHVGLGGEVAVLAER